MLNFSIFLVKGTVIQIEKSLINNRLRVSSILKISHLNYLKFCSNFLGKFDIFLKSYLQFNNFYYFSNCKQNFTA